MRIEPHQVYRVRLCSGECCQWEYLGIDELAIIWWKDLESGRVFNEGNLMYVWDIIGVVG